MLREYERLAKNGDASAERRLFELKKRAGCLDIYVVEENYFDYSLILGLYFSFDEAVNIIDEKCATYRRYKKPNKPVKWRRIPFTKDTFHKGAELAYIWRPEEPQHSYADPSYTVTCFIK